MLEGGEKKQSRQKGRQVLGRIEKESRLQLLERITMERPTKKVTFEERFEEGEGEGPYGWGGEEGGKEGER